MRTDLQLTVAKGSPPWGLASKLIMLLFDYLL